MYVKVECFTGRNGRAIPNQYKIHTKEGIFFQSYDKLIALKRSDGKIILDKKYKNYSRTTMKYLKRFLMKSPDMIKEGIRNGEIILTDLNS